jgi:hypothetical protein
VRSLGCSAVFADQAAEDLLGLDPGSDMDSVAGFVQRGSLLERLVRPVTVVMPRVLGQDLTEMTLAGNQHVVEALAAKCSHEPFRDGVHRRRPDRCLDYLPAVPGEDLVEGRKCPSSSRAKAAIMAGPPSLGSGA